MSPETSGGGPPDTQPRRGATRRWSAADMRLLAPAVVVALVALAAAGQFPLKLVQIRPRNRIKEKEKRNEMERFWQTQ